jgi:hypothetical protein
VFRPVASVMAAVAMAFSILHGVGVAAQDPERGCASNSIPGLNVPDSSFCKYYDVFMNAGPVYDIDPDHLGRGWMANAWAVGNFGHRYDDVLLAGQIIYGPQQHDVSAWQKVNIKALKYNGNGTFNDFDEFFAPDTDRAQFLCSYMTTADYLGDGRLGFACANEGIDTYPFPGEPSQVFVVSPRGLVNATVDRLPSDGQGHGAASGIIDKTGRPAIFVAVVGSPLGGSPHPVPPYLLINNGNGEFKYNTSRLPYHLIETWPQGDYVSRRFSAAALVDTTGSGVADLIVGTSHLDPAFPQLDAHGNSIAYHSYVYVNPGDGDFSKSREIVLPDGCFGNATEVIAIASADFEHNRTPYLLLEEARVVNGGGYTGNCLQILERKTDGYVDVTNQMVNGALDTDARADHRITVIDLNHDGFLDVVVQAWSDGSQATWEGSRPRNASYILLNDGRNHFAVLNDSFLPGFPVYNEALIPIDLERDGHVSFLAPYDDYRDGRHYREFALYRWKADMPQLQLR